MPLPTGLVLRPVRYFVNHHCCPSCDNEWTDEALTMCHSWCDYCGTKVEPFLSEALIEDMVCDADEEDE